MQQQRGKNVIIVGLRVELFFFFHQSNIFLMQLFYKFVSLDIGKKKKKKTRTHVWACIIFFFPLVLGFINLFIYH